MQANCSSPPTHKLRRDSIQRKPKNQMEIAQKRDRRSLTRCSNLRNPSTAAAAMQAIAQAQSRRIVSGDDGGVQVKFVISKKELKQMIGSMGWGRSGGGGPTTAAALEHLLHVLRKRHAKRTEFAEGGDRKWQPALQSIPEEL